MWASLSYGAAQYQVGLKGGHAIASTNSSDVWKKGGSEENLCAQPYHGEYWERLWLTAVFGASGLERKFWSVLESYTGESSEQALVPGTE